MKCFLVPIVCSALCCWPCFAQPVNVPKETPTPAPGLPAIDVTEGYGAAKWGMSTAEFEKTFPQAKLERDIEEDVWAQRSASKVYSMGNDSLKMRFEFLRGKLVIIDLETKMQGSPYNGGSMVQRDLRSIEDRIARQFPVQQDSGVFVRVQFPYRYGMQPPLGVNGPPVMAIAPQLPAIAPAPGVPAVPGAPAPVAKRRPVQGLQGFPGGASQSDDANAAPVVVHAAPVASTVVEIYLSHGKLIDSLEREFTKEIAAAQNKAVEEVLTKLAPPK